MVALERPRLAAPARSVVHPLLVSAAWVAPVAVLASSVVRLAELLELAPLALAPLALALLGWQVVPALGVWAAQVPLRGVPAGGSVARRVMA